jgi:hypothetical protein
MLRKSGPPPFLKTQGKSKSSSSKQPESPFLNIQTEEDEDPPSFIDKPPADDVAEGVTPIAKKDTNRRMRKQNT